MEHCRALKKQHEAIIKDQLKQQSFEQTRQRLVEFYFSHFNKNSFAFLM